MDVASLEAAIKARALDLPFYLFAGTEEFLKERACERLVQAYVAPEDVADNVHRLDLGVSDEADLFAGLGSFTFNESPRIFLLTNLDALPTARRAAFLDRLAGLPSLERTFLIFLAGEAGLAAEVMRRLGARCERVDFWAPFENQMIPWIQKEAREAGAIITAEAAEELLDKTGHDLRLIVQELGKLALQVGKGGTITPALVETAVGYLRQDSVFDLVDAVGRRDAPRALRIAENLMHQGQAALRLWFPVVSALREFRLLHDLAADRPDLVTPVTDRLRSILRLHGRSDYKANQERKTLIDQIQQLVADWPPLLAEAILPNPRKARHLAQALNYTRRELIELWPRLLEMDAAFKTTPVSEVLFLQECLLEIIAPPALRQRPPALEAIPLE
ncbi:MAG: DNA polymerase III delta subunit [Candidatus Ozemobacter sibiricus]|jgi:DNA polymerase-3 subunit delta|uniref:DNA-directed DNA polymerase n=1 Tax=Candidatus Ozemobacter sibiricus TaxID=2268124 RepID=A0A367ZRE3_9BACT|nr:MAG: DNA polymerase III delta subunit [Candidatus Ozemobacter sibiricus]